jgi:hypothetical protein
MQVQGSILIEMDQQEFAPPLNGADAQTSQVFRTIELVVQDDELLDDGAHDRLFQLAAKRFHFRKFRHTLFLPSDFSG